MALKAKLRFRDNLPWETERVLFNRFGFRIHARKMHEYLIVEKQALPRAVRNKLQVIEGGKSAPVSQAVQAPTIVLENKLPVHTVADLMKRINNICNMFPNQRQEQTYVIRTRLNNICQTLPREEANFVRDWMEENMPED